MQMQRVLVLGLRVFEPGFTRVEKIGRTRTREMKPAGFNKSTFFLDLSITIGKSIQKREILPKNYMKILEMRFNH